MPNRSNLHGYQLKAIDHIKSRHSSALWLDMGLGKTVSALTAITDILNGFDCCKALIIAPLRVAKKTWPDEIKTWEHTTGLTFDVLAGQKPDTRRDTVLFSRSDVHIINREQVPWLVQLLKDSKHSWPYDLIIIDESSSFKSSSAQRFKALKRVLANHSPRVVELTGTPASNGLLDLWAQAYLLDKGKRLGKTFSGFRAKYFDRDFQGYNWTPKSGAQKDIYEALSDIVLVMKAEDYLDLPQAVSTKQKLALPLSAMATYEDLEKEFITVVENETLAVTHAATLAGKLLQLANGAIYLEDGTWKEIHTAKLEALEDRIEAAGSAPLLVPYNFKHDLERIKSGFPQAEVLGKDPETIDRWNAGKIPLLLAHPASAGHGLNLQAGGHHIEWFGLNWSLELYNQFNGRLNRQGQTKPVMINHLVAEGTIDEAVLATLSEKHATEQGLLNALKTKLEKRKR